MMLMKAGEFVVEDCTRVSVISLEHSQCIRRTAVTGIELVSQNSWVIASFVARALLMPSHTGSGT